MGNFEFWNFWIRDMKRGWPSQRQPPRFLDLLKKFYYFFGDSCPQHRKKERKGLDKCVDATNILVWVGRTKWQIFTTNHEMTVYLINAIICTILYACKWYQSTGNSFVNIGNMSTNMEKLQTNSEFPTVLWILESIDKCLTQMDFSYKKYLPFPPI